MSADREQTEAVPIPERSRENPFQEGTFLEEVFEDVLMDQRDIIILVDDYRGRRGTGKTVFSMQLADEMDQTDEGLTKEKVSLQPEEIRNAYSSQPKGSGLVLDEGEVGASNREAMTKTNQALREIMSMGRVEQKYLVVNAPIKSFIDKDIQKLADVWISMIRRGKGLVHHLKWMPYKETLHTPKKGFLEAPDIERGTELREVYNYLTREKTARIDGNDGQQFVPLGEHEKELEKARKEVRIEARNEVIRNLMSNPEVQETAISQRMVAESIGLTQPTVSDILSGSNDAD